MRLDGRWTLRMLVPTILGSTGAGSKQVTSEVERGGAVPKGTALDEFPVPSFVQRLDSPQLQRPGGLNL
jgi:hypothetical protein